MDMKFNFDLRKLNHHHSIYCKCTEKIDLQTEELIISKSRIAQKCEVVKHMLESIELDQDFQ